MFSNISKNWIPLDNRILWVTTNRREIKMEKDILTFVLLLPCIKMIPKA